MAKMHTKKKGKSRSYKPVLDTKDFGKGTEKLSKEDIEKIIVDYAKSGLSPALIGEKLKKEHDVKYVKQAVGKRMVALLKENKIKSEVPQDMLDLMKKAVRMRAHLSANKQDKYNSVRLLRIESKIFRLSRYYTREGVLPHGWKYDPEKAQLIVKGKA